MFSKSKYNKIALLYFITTQFCVYSIYNVGKIKYE